MTAQEFRDALALLDLSVAGFADLLVALGDVANDKERTVQRWAAGKQDIPGAVVAVLQLLVLLQDERGIGAAEVRAWADDAAAPENDEES